MNIAIQIKFHAASFGRGLFERAQAVEGVFVKEAQAFHLPLARIWNRAKIRANHFLRLS